MLDGWGIVDKLVLIRVVCVCAFVHVCVYMCVCVCGWVVY